MIVDHLQGFARTVRRIDVGGFSTQELIAELNSQSVLLNGYAERLLASENFTTFAERYGISTVHVRVRELGFDAGARIPTSLRVRRHKVLRFARSSSLPTSGSNISTNPNRRTKISPRLELHRSHHSRLPHHGLQGPTTFRKDFTLEGSRVEIG